MCRYQMYRWLGVSFFHLFLFMNEIFNFFFFFLSVVLCICDLKTTGEKKKITFYFLDLLHIFLSYFPFFSIVDITPGSLVYHYVFACVYGRVSWFSFFVCLHCTYIHENPYGAMIVTRAVACVVCSIHHNSIPSPG